MNKIISKFLLTGDKFMPEFYLKQPGFICSAYGPFTKHCKRIQKFKETSNSEHLYGNELDKACFVHKACFARDAAYSDSKDLAKKTISGKVLKYRAYEIDKNCNYDENQGELASMVYKFFDKKAGSGEIATSKAGVSEKLHKPIIKNNHKKFKRRKVYARFKNNKCAADLTEMKSLPSNNKNFKYLLCVIDVFTKNVRVKPLKDKKSKAVFNSIIEIVNECNCKPNKLWIDQGRKFYNKIMQELLDNNMF